MHVWSPIAKGAIDIICGPLLPCVFRAELALQDPGNPERAIAGILNPADGTVAFHISDADVQLIKTTNARLMLRTEHTLIPGSPYPRWGWRYTIVHSPGQLTVTEMGAPVPLDGHGYFSPPPEPYPANSVALTNKAIDLQ